MQQIINCIVMGLSIGSVLVQTSCRKDESGPTAAASGPADPTAIACDDGEDKVQLTYYDNVKPILDQYCVSCHNPAASLNAGKGAMAFTNYEAARKWAYLMPEFRLFAELEVAEQTAITDWIAGGLAEQFYLDEVKPVLDANCISCHEENAAERKDQPTTDFTDPAVVRSFGSRMAIFGPLKQVPDEQQRILEAWIDQGLQLGIAPQD